MMRRFVNLVTLNWEERVYSVRRMDTYKQLFYQSAKAAIEAADEATSVPALQLLPPCMNFTATNCGGTMGMFALFSPRANHEGRIVHANMIGEAGLYDADKHVLTSLGALNGPKGISPMCLSMAPHPGASQDSMYVLDRFPGKASDRCFEVLEPVPSRNELSSSFMGSSRWRLLPPPPFVHQPGFETARHDPSCRLGWSPSEEWSYVGAWRLPFHDRAQYVPEFNRWLGFLGFRPYHLCAVDLSAVDGERPPAALKVGQDLNLPDGEGWIAVYLELVNLGNGKFLTAKIFESEVTSEQFAVLTGIEVIMAVSVMTRALRWSSTSRHILT
uniref:Uncharacterized protein n=1 Tax=Avena sativa TaxID=4498 RepID=A0ACD5WE91_AVESA